ncbi:MAG TPA: T9SS type A sorting domain-containing protein [Candidatus Marinimicrobia bacterium]|nr:T9SS type A sorting domain-containing protein [Candidatus Neomarinimicrobiota bacterium]
MEIMFQEAANGNDQMVCLWSHLPQTDFLYGMEKLNEFAHEFADQYDVEFMYCKDTEAMRLWINPDDTIPPVLTINEIVESKGIRFVIETDGPIFQIDEPYIAVKTVYETYKRLDCTITGENQWETIEPIPADQLAKVSVAVCDSVGNQAKVHLDYLPDDLFVDNKDSEFQEISGNWQNHTTGELWNLNARKVQGPGSVKITPDIEESRVYSIFFHGPGSDTDSARCVVQTGTASDTVLFTSRLEGTDKWQHVGFFHLYEGFGNTIIFENLSPDKTLGLDVVRITPLVADKFFRTSHDMIAFGEVSAQDTTVRVITFSNTGREELTISSASWEGEKIMIPVTFPLILGPMESLEIPVFFYTDEFCEYTDLLTLETDDPLHSIVEIPISVFAMSFFKLVDNDDPKGYVEHGSGWFTSVATAYGPTSRCVGISATGVANYKYADFTTRLNFSGTYDIQFIVPKTVNAHNCADYIILIDSVPQDTFVVDQNIDSGAFVSVCEYDLPKNLPITLRIQDNGGNSNAGSVLRADAVKFLLVEEKYVSGTEDLQIPREFRLNQNYPNPFNPVTNISFDLPVQSKVSLAVYDITGRMVREWEFSDREAGRHEILWNGTNNFGQQISTGVYILRMKANHFTDTKKMVFMK